MRRGIGYRSAIAAIPQYVEMAKHNGTWLIGILSLGERLLEETTHPETLKTRPELRLLPPYYQQIVIDHNPYLTNAGPGSQSIFRTLLNSIDSLSERSLLPAFLFWLARMLPYLALGMGMRFMMSLKQWSAQA